MRQTALYGVAKHAHDNAGLSIWRNNFDTFAELTYCVRPLVFHRQQTDEKAEGE